MIFHDINPQLMYVKQQCKHVIIVKEAQDQVENNLALASKTSKS